MVYEHEPVVVKRIIEINVYQSICGGESFIVDHLGLRFSHGLIVHYGHTIKVGKSFH